MHIHPKLTFLFYIKYRCDKQDNDIGSGQELCRLYIADIYNKLHIGSNKWEQCQYKYDVEGWSLQHPNHIGQCDGTTHKYEHSSDCTNRHVGK